MVVKNLSWVFSFANSVVGVGVLAMPFCFQKCGLILASLMILVYAYLTKKTCEYLLRASSSSRKSAFEQIAQFSYGDLGKLIIEVSTIALLFGTLIAFQVVIGDLAPSVIHSFLSFEKTWALRIFLMALSCCGILPLSLLRNISSLSSLNTLSICFYGFFICIITFTALPSFLTFEWMYRAKLWDFSTVFQILPIIAMSFTCQTQVLVMYAALPDPSMLLMTEIINKAVDLVSIIYIAVGASGYIAFYETHIHGDVLENFVPGFITQVIKLGFWLSVMISFPLLAFPVRSAINSLVFSKKKQGVLEDMISSASDYIAPEIFSFITFALVGCSLFVGILVPKIEIVLSVTGALFGTFLCLIAPTWLFLSNGAKDRSKKIAQVILCVSVLSMVFSTMSVLSSINQPNTQPVKEQDSKIAGIVSMTTTTAAMKQGVAANDIIVRLPSVKVGKKSVDSLENAERLKEEKLQVKPIHKVEVNDIKQQGKDDLNAQKKLAANEAPPQATTTFKPTTFESTTTLKTFLRSLHKNVTKNR